MSMTNAFPTTLSSCKSGTREFDPRQRWQTTVGRSNLLQATGQKIKKSDADS